MGILNAISLFIIMGVGVDDLFVFYNFYQQAKPIQNLYIKMAWVYRKSAKAAFGIF